MIIVWGIYYCNDSFPKLNLEDISEITVVSEE